MKRTVRAMEEGVDAQEPSSKRCKTEEDEPDTILELEMHEFECVICADLMVDPVVGRCGHDFCKECLEDWIHRNRHNPHCPVCRKSLGSSNEQHGVCLRLKDLIEKLYPRRAKDRRKEVEAEAADRRRRREQEAEQRNRDRHRALSFHEMFPYATNVNDFLDQLRVDRSPAGNRMRTRLDSRRALRRASGPPLGVDADLVGFPVMPAPYRGAGAATAEGDANRRFGAGSLTREVGDLSAAAAAAAAAAARGAPGQHHENRAAPWLYPGTYLGSDWPSVSGLQSHRETDRTHSSRQQQWYRRGLPSGSHPAGDARQPPPPPESSQQRTVTTRSMHAATRRQYAAAAQARRPGTAARRSRDPDQALQQLYDEAASARLAAIEARRAAEVAAAAVQAVSGHTRSAAAAPAADAAEDNATSRRTDAPVVERPDRYTAQPDIAPAAAGADGIGAALAPDPFFRSPYQPPMFPAATAGSPPPPPPPPPPPRRLPAPMDLWGMLSEPLLDPMDVGERQLPRLPGGFPPPAAAEGAANRATGDASAGRQASPQMPQAMDDDDVLGLAMVSHALGEHPGRPLIRIKRSASARNPPASTAAAAAEATAADADADADVARSNAVAAAHAVVIARARQRAAERGSAATTAATAEQQDESTDAADRVVNYPGGMAARLRSSLSESAAAGVAGAGAAAATAGADRQAMATSREMPAADSNTPIPPSYERVPAAYMSVFWRNEPAGVNVRGREVSRDAGAVLRRSHVFGSGRHAELQPGAAAGHEEQQGQQQEGAAGTDSRRRDAFLDTVGARGDLRGALLAAQRRDDVVETYRRSAAMSERLAAAVQSRAAAEQGSDAAVPRPQDMLREDDSLDPAAAPAAAADARAAIAPASAAAAAARDDAGESSSDSWDSMRLVEFERRLRRAPATAAVAEGRWPPSAAADLPSAAVPPPPPRAPSLRAIAAGDRQARRHAWGAPIARDRVQRPLAVQWAEAGDVVSREVEDGGYISSDTDE